MLLFKQGMAIALLVAMSGLVMAKPTVDYCATCQSVSEFMHEMELNQTASVMKTNLYKTCLKENDGSNSRVCVFLATTMQNTLGHIGSEDFCTKINACPSGKPLVKPVTVNKERCEFCTNLLDSFKSLVSDSSSDLLKESLDSFCALTGDFEDECKKSIHKNLANFVDFVTNKMDSETFCHAVSSCHYQTLEEKRNPSVGDLLSLRDPQQIASHLDMLEQEAKFNELATFDADQSTDQSVELGNPLSCMVCRQVVVIIYSQLHKNATRENVEGLLAKSCKTIYFRNKEKEKLCEEKVIKNAETILNGFINHIPPDLVCILTGMCLPGKHVQEQSTPLKEVPDLIQIQPKNNQISILDSIKQGVHLGQSYKCYFCEKIVQFLFKELDEAKTREYIKHLLDRSCSTLFKKEERESKCEEYVNAYTDKLIDLIEKASNPGVICNSLHMCPVNMTMLHAWENKKLDSTIDSRPIEPEKVSGPVFVINWCKVCQRAYPVATEIIQIDAVREKITAVAHDFCEKQILPIKDCAVKADQYIEVIAKVRDQEDGCKQLTLCPAPGKQQAVDQVSVDLQVFDLASIDEPGKLQPFGWFDDMKCSACKILIKGLYANLNKTVHSPDTKRWIDQTCEHIHQDELKQKCKDDAQAALETLVKDLTESFPPQTACELMTYCKKKEDVDYSALFKPFAQNGVCNACKTLFPVLHRILQNEQTREKAKNIVKQICDHSNKPDECTQSASDLIDSLADEETAASGCSSLCQENAFTSTLFGRRMSECTVCQTSMVILDEIVQNRDFQHRLNSSLENFCEARGDKTQENCKHIVRENLPKMYEMVKNITDHDTGFCPTFGFCNVTKTSGFSSGGFAGDVDDLLKGAEELLPSEGELLDEPFMLEKPGQQSQVCEGCKKVFGRLQQVVREHKGLKDELLKHLIATCPKQDDKCRQFYKKYINYFYSQLLRNTDPERVCPLIKLCPEDFALIFPDAPTGDEDWQPALELTDTTVCKECQSAVEYLVNTLNNKTVIDFMLKEVQQNVCQPLSFIERKACNRLVKQFGPKIIAHFVQRINEDNICVKHLRLCKNEAINRISIDKPEDMDFELINFVEDPNCIVCTRSVDRLNVIRGESSKKYSIEEICGKNDPECSEFMLNFQDFFLQNDHNRDSILACTELNVCLIPGKVQLLGGDKCKFGPAYSCLSSAHAEACKTTKFCEQNYWVAVSN